MRTVWTFTYAISFLFYASRKLKQVKKTTTFEQQETIHQVPKYFGKQVVKRSGSEVIVTGEENIPEGSFLIVSNHQGNFDIFTLLGYFKKPFGFIAKIELSRIPVAKPWMDYMGCLFLDRNNRRQSVETFKQGIKMLEQGYNLAIFPEGTRTKSSKMGEFKSGSFSLAKKSNVPVLPVMINGTYKSMEANNNRITPGTFYLTICEPIMPEEYESMSLQELSDETQKRIQLELDRLEGVTYKEEEQLA
ncbi:lysophospholipid acyltransferase family protein [Alkalibacillus haloalkaliphilus]|uniref:lysophospholipid acyltransferase family protein n=1 Tax=Alkalibacillus haloalkaliphilus TaxID=94136 RepID=UPI0003195CDC|nr:lysophospholipid acyltransferase family protein [Alkalibacillus haloalkaliphilus]